MPGSRTSYLFASTQQTDVGLRFLFRMVLLLSALAIANPSSANDRRIISADLGTTYILQALGLKANLVAVDAVSSRLPEFATTPSIGYHRQLSAEGLLSLRADALIGSSSMGPSQALKILERTGTDITRLETPYTIDALRQNIATLAALFGTHEQGAEIDSALLQKETALDLHALPFKKAVLLLRMHGHGSSSGSVAGRNTSGDAFLTLLGVNNAADFDAYREVSPESLLAMSPDLIVVATDASTNARPQDQSVANGVGNLPLRVYMQASALVAGLSVTAVDEALRIKQNLLLAQNQLRREN